MIKYNANLDAKDDYQQAPVLKSIMNKHWAITRFLLQKEADATIADKYGNTLLHWASKVGATLEVIDDLLKKINIDGKENSSVPRPIVWAVENNQVEITSELLKRGARIDLPDEQGSLMHSAAIVKDLDEKMIPLLQKYKVPIDLMDDSGDTCVHVSVRKKRPKTTEPLLKHGASLNTFNKMGYSPLHLGAQATRLQEVEVLLKHNADIKLKTRNRQPKTALALATKKGHNDMIELLKKNTSWWPF